MAKRIGFQTQQFRGGIIGQYIQSRAAVCKPINDFNADALKAYRDHVGGYIFPRVWVDDVDLTVATQTAQIVADRVSTALDPIKSLTDATFFLNEMRQNGDDLKWLNEATVRYCEIMHGRGYGVIVGSFSVGNPANPRELNFFKDALIAGDFYDRHSYGAPHLDQPDSTSYSLRHRLDRQVMLDMGDPRVLKSFLLGEVGIDGGVLGSQHAREGWKKFISAPEYLVELQAFDARIASDSYVIGAVVFGLGMNDDWFGFDVDGSAELMTWLGAQGTLPKLIHQNGNGGGAMPVGIGFQTWRTLEQDVIGDFVESEVWHDLADTNRETSTVWTTHGQLRWFRQFNTMDFRTNGGRYRIYNGGNPRWLN